MAHLRAGTTIGGHIAYHSGTIIPLRNGGTGSNLSDPGIDRILFWDDSAGEMTWLSVGNGLDISTTTLQVDVSDFMTNGSNNRVLTATGTDGINAEANLTFDGTTLTGLDIVAGSISRASNTYVRALTADGYNAGFEAYGNSQGTGYVYVGQSDAYGGGMFYNGDGSPAFATGESADRISFYRRTSSANTVVFSYSHSSSDVTFSASISAASGTITASGGNSSEWNLAYDNMITAASFNTGDGILTLTQQDAGTITVDLDGRYQTSDTYVGTVTSIATGTGIAGGTITTSGTISLDLGELSVGGTLVGTDYLVAENGGVDNRQLISSIPLSIFNNDAGWTTNTGTVTNVTVGTGLDVANGTTTPNITLDLSEFTDMTAAVDGAADELILLDSGAERRKLISEITLSDFNNDAGWTSNAGTVTSIGITAGNLIDVSGSPVTGSGNITVNVDLTELTTSTTNSHGDYFVVTDATGPAQYKLTKANIALSGFNNDAGWTSNTGDITNVSAGTGISGGGSSGSVTLTLDLGELSVGGTLVGTDYLVAENGGVDNRQLISSIPLSIFNNDAGWTTNTGTMSSFIIEEGNGTETSTVTNGETIKFAQSTGMQIEMTSTSGGGTLTFTNTSPNVTTNLSTTHNASTVVINSSDGSDATINAANSTTAGIMTEAMYDNHVLNNAKITNATHTGQVTGSGALSLTVSAITDQTELTTAPISTDELLINDGGVLKRVDLTYVKDYMNNYFSTGAAKNLWVARDDYTSIPTFTWVDINTNANYGWFPYTADDTQWFIAGDGFEFSIDSTGVKGIKFSHEDTSTLSGFYGGSANGVVIEDITVDGMGHVTSIGTVDLDTRFAAVSHSHSYDNYGGWNFRVDGNIPGSDGYLSSNDTLYFVSGTAIDLVGASDQVTFNVDLGTGATQAAAGNHTHNYAGAATPGAAATNSLALGGYGLSTSGNRWGVIPWVASDGTFEGGKYLDFHETDGSTADYDGRLSVQSNALYFQPFGGSQYNVLTRQHITTTEESNWNTAYSWGNHASAGYGTMSSFILEDGDGTEVSISNLKEIKFVEGVGNGASININWTDTSTGSDADPFDLTFTITNTDKGSSQNIFKNFAVSGQNTVVADSNNDTMTFVAGTNMTITTDNTTDTITFAAAGSGSGTVTSVAAGNGMDFTTITASGSVTMGTPSTLTSATSNGVTSTSHTHAITTGIANGNIVKVSVSGVLDNDYAKFTSTGLEGRSAAEVRSDIGAAATSHSHDYLPLDGSSDMYGNIHIAVDSDESALYLGEMNGNTLAKSGSIYWLTDPINTTWGTDAEGFAMIHDSSQEKHYFKSVNGGAESSIWTIRKTNVVEFNNTPTAAGYTMWHAGNDGSGSNLDADLLDGQHGSYYATAAHTHDWSDLEADLTGTTVVTAATAVTINWESAVNNTLTMTSATDINFSNLVKNKTITLELAGNYTPTFESYVDILSGSYDTSQTNLIIFYCTNNTVGSEQVWCTINQV